MAKEDLLTHEAIVLETNAVQRARDLGRDELPAEDANDLDICEMDVVRKCEDRARDLINQAKAEFRKELSNQKIRSAGELMAVLNGIKTSVRATIQKAFQSEKPILSEAYKEMKRRQRDYRHFRSSNELTREPHYIRSKWRKILITTIILIFEIAANGAFLGTVSEGGAGEGALKIFFLSGAIVAVGYGTGFMARYFNHKRAYVGKVVAAISLVLGPLLVVTAGFYAAHNRLHIIEIMNEVDAPISIIESMQVQLFSIFNSLETTILLIAAVLAGAGAGLEGYKSWDPYPGYDRVHRLWDQKREAYEAAKANAISRVEAEVVALRDNAAKIADEALANISLANQLSAKLGRLKSDVEHYTSKANDVCRSVLKEFREENKKVRGGAKAPSYFSTYPTLRIDASLMAEEGALKEAGLSEEAYQRVAELGVQVKEDMAGLIQDTLERSEEFYGTVEEGATNELSEEEKLPATSSAV